VLSVLLLLFLLAGNTTVSAGDSGHVRFVKVTSPAFDRYTDRPTPAQAAWMRGTFWRMVAYTPYFDKRTGALPQALAYKDLYAVRVGSRQAAAHPDRLLRDRTGRPLFIPWHCDGRRCPQYAGDITSPAFRAAWIASARRTLARGYRGLFIDDVNLHFAVSDGAGDHVDPVDRRTGRPMTATAWREQTARFLEQIRRALPGAEIHHNAVWFAASRPGVPAGADPYVRREIRAADTVSIERGIVDRRLTGGTGRFSLYALFAYVDVVHRLHRTVTMASYASSRAEQRYQLAGSLLVNTGGDALSDAVSTPRNFWSGYRVDLGPAAGRRQRDSAGLWRREFARGLVLLNEPGAPTRTVDVPAGLCSPDGTRAPTVSLPAAAGEVLTRCR
jgi:hypothetical protein